VAIIGGSPLLWPTRTGETSCALPSSEELFIAYGTKLSCTAVQKHCVYFHSCYREKVTLSNVQKLAIIGDCTLYQQLPVTDFCCCVMANLSSGMSLMLKK